MQVWSNRLVLILTVRRTGFDSRGRNLEICNLRIPSKSWSTGPWLRVSLKHFMRHFTLSPHWRPRWYVTIDGLIILSIAMNGSISLDGRTGMVPTPCTVRTLGTQAIDYSWANLMYTMPHHTPSGRTQDFDGIRRLHISRLRPRESNSVRLRLKSEGLAD